MENKQILEEIEKIKQESCAYQKANILSKSEMELKDNICVSDEFIDGLFEEIAIGLGIKLQKK